MTIDKITNLPRFKDSPFAAAILPKADAEKWEFKSAILSPIGVVGCGCVAEFVSRPTKDRLLTIGAEQRLNGTIDILTEMEKSNYSF